MMMKKYVKRIIIKLKCSGKKRKEIKQQLLSDISISLENGEPIGKDGVFKESLAKAQMKNIITWVNEENYDELKEHSISLLQPTWNGKTDSPDGQTAEQKRPGKNKTAAESLFDRGL